MSFDIHFCRVLFFSINNDAAGQINWLLQCSQLTFTWLNMASYMLLMW